MTGTEPTGQPRQPRRNLRAQVPEIFDKGKEAILTVEQAAKILGCHPKTLARRCKRGTFPHRNDGSRGGVRIFLSELVAWLDRKKGVKLR